MKSKSHQGARKNTLLGLAFITALTFGAGDAYAQCTSPASPAGGLQYFTATTDYRYCDGTNWVAWGSGGAGGADTEIQFNSSGSLAGTDQFNILNQTGPGVDNDKVFIGDFQDSDAATVNHSHGLSYSGMLNVLGHPGTQTGIIHAAAASYTAAATRDSMYGLITITNRDADWDSTPAPVQQNDYLLGLGFAGYTTTSHGPTTVLGASIHGFIDGAVSSEVLPTSLVFSTTATNESGLTEQMVIDSVGDIVMNGTGALTVHTGTTAQRPGTGVDGMLRYNNTNSSFEGYQAGAWREILTTGLAVNELDDLGDAVTDYTNNNMYAGSGAGGSNGVITNYHYNMGIGINSMVNIGTGCAAAGGHECQNNTAFGYNTMNAGTTAWDNTAIGHEALEDVTTGYGNTALGKWALRNVTSGESNVALGVRALDAADTSYENTAVGNAALSALNGANWNNTALGNQAGEALASGRSNTFIGTQAGEALTGGSDNTFIGQWAGRNQTAGDNNIIIGQNIDLPNLTGHNQLNIGGVITGDLSTGDIQIVGTAALTTPIGTTAQRPGTAVNGMLRYNSTTGRFEGYQAGSWQDIITAGGGAAAINDLSDASTDYATTFNMFLGDSAGNASTNGLRNVALGQNALGSLDTACATSLHCDENVAIGYNALTANTTGYLNTAVGNGALDSNTTGILNTAIGSGSMSDHLSGNNNTALGHNALRSNTTGHSSTAIGTDALHSNNASSNVALGSRALYSNVGKDRNTAIGTRAMEYADDTSTGFEGNNVAVGYYALRGSTTASNNTGGSNVAIGVLTLENNTAGGDSVAIGARALNTNAAKSRNTAVGFESMRYAHDTTTASNSNNTALGYQALRGSTTASNNSNVENVAVGSLAMQNVTSGSWNVAVGYQALQNNATGVANVAIGKTVLPNSSASDNTAVGFQSMFSSTSGGDNSAYGAWSLADNTTGAENTAIGRNALRSSVSKARNTAVGFGAMYYADDASSGGNGNNVAVGRYAMRGSTTASNNTGTANTAVGSGSMQSLTSGTDNVAQGFQSLFAANTGFANVGLGSSALAGVTGGDRNIGIGYNAGDNITTGNRNIVIGNDIDATSATGNDQLNIGDTIYGDLANDYVGIANSSPDVELDVTGDIEYTGTITDVSDARLKDNIAPMDNILDRIAQLEAYSFTMKGDEKSRTEFGVMAQDLEKVFPELVHTANDEIGTKSVNYIGLIAPMIEATKELSAENAALKAEIADIKTAQAQTNEVVASLGDQVELLNKIASVNNTSPASMQSILLVLLGLLGGAGLMLVITRKTQEG